MFKLNNVTGTISIPNDMIIDSIPESVGDPWDGHLRRLDIDLRRDIGKNLAINATYSIPSIVMRQRGNQLVSDDMSIVANVKVNDVVIPSILTGRFSTDMKSFSFNGTITLDPTSTNNMIRDMISRIISTNNTCRYGLVNCKDKCGTTLYPGVLECLKPSNWFNSKCDPSVAIHAGTVATCTTMCNSVNSLTSVACRAIDGLVPVIMPIVMKRHTGLYEHDINYRAGSVRLSNIGNVNLPCDGIPMDIEGGTFKAKICYSLQTGLITGKTYIESKGIKFYGNILRGNDSITISNAIIDAGSMVTALRFITDYLSIGSIEMSESIIRGLGLQPVLGMDVLDLIEKQSGG